VPIRPGTIWQPPNSSRPDCNPGWDLYEDGAGHYICVKRGGGTPGAPWRFAPYGMPRQSPTALGLQTRASGGPVEAGQMYLVGEDGPEVVRFDRGGYVYNAQQTRDIMARSGDLIEGMRSGGAVPGQENAQRFDDVRKWWENYIAQMQRAYERNLATLAQMYRNARQDGDLDEARRIEQEIRRVQVEMDQEMANARRDEEAALDGIGSGDSSGGGTHHKKKARKKKKHHRAYGGSVWPGEDFEVGEYGPEMFVASLRPAGSVMAPGLATFARTRGAQATTAGATVGAASRPNLTVNVTVSGTNLDVHQLSNRIQRETVAAVVQVFDQYERAASDPVSPVLPGAQR
jgi:hypothetical protein